MPIAAVKTQVVPSADTSPESPIYLNIRDLIYKISGIYYADEKLYLLISRCGRRMAALGGKGAEEYLEHLTTRGNRDNELRLLLNEITSAKLICFVIRRNSMLFVT